MTYQQLIREISDKTSLPSQRVNSALKSVVEILTFSLRRGDKISLPGFGNFLVLTYPSRSIAHPLKPGEKLITLGSKVVKFHPSSKMKLNLREIKKSSLAKAGPINIPYIDLSKISIPKEILALVPEHIARHYQVAPVEEKEGTLAVAMIDPEDLEVVELLKKKTGKKIERRLTTTADLNRILDQYSGVSGEVERIVETEADKEKVEEKKPKKAAKALEIAEDAPAAKIVSSLLKRAVHERASDIHIEPTEDEVVIRFRIDGVLRKIVSLPVDLLASLVSRVKILTNMKIDETRLPQDGRFQTVVDNSEIDFRVSTLPTVNGEKVVARILDKSAGILTLEQLGLRGHAFEKVSENVKKAHGMTLSTGPTGSGKTTTLYAIIDQINAESINIVTLEDPVEYRIKGINQSQVKADIGFTFENGLRSIVRQDPDVIMVGEIRDFETANLAVHASLTGHVVLSTLHTNDASGTTPRLIDMKIEPFLIVSTVNVIIGQRLARRVCDDCKKEIEVPTPEMETVKNQLKNLPEVEQKEISEKKMVFFKGQGCNICGNSGYKGRVGIFEVLTMEGGVKDLVLNRASSDKILLQAQKQGMVSMQQDGILKAQDGLTTLEEVWRVTQV